MTFAALGLTGVWVLAGSFYPGLGWDSEDPMALRVVGIFMTSIFALLFFGRGSVTVSGGKVRVVEGFWLLGDVTEIPVSQLKGVRLSYEVGVTDRRRRVFRVTLLGRGSVVVCEPRNYLKARRVAERLSAEAGIKMTDATLSPPVERRAGEIDQTWADRVRAGRAGTGNVDEQPPTGSRMVPLRPGTPTAWGVGIPPRGLRKATFSNCLFDIGVVVAGLALLLWTQFRKALSTPLEQVFSGPLGVQLGGSIAIGGLIATRALWIDGAVGERVWVVGGRVVRVRTLWGVPVWRRSIRASDIEEAGDTPAGALLLRGDRVSLLLGTELHKSDRAWLRDSLAREVAK